MQTTAFVRRNHRIRGLDFQPKTVSLKMVKTPYFSALLLLLSLLVVLDGCVSGKAASKSGGSTGAFKDDLSAFRPVYQAEEKAAETQPAQPADNKPVSKATPTGDMTKQLNTILDTIAVRNRRIRYANGYRVQIYSGTSREDANNARNRSYALFPDITPHIAYVQPNFRVKVGDFIDRLEAQRVYAGLSGEFPNSLILAERIEIR